MGKISKSEPRHRICYEYADHGDFWDLIAWYHTQRYRPYHQILYAIVIIDTKAQTALFFRKLSYGIFSTPWRTHFVIAAMGPISHRPISPDGTALSIWI